jgi:hypothetical protein
VSGALARREPQVVHGVVRAAQPGRAAQWEQWWRTGEGYVVSCRHRHDSAPRAAVCAWRGTADAAGWTQLGIHPTDWTAS